MQQNQAEVDQKDFMRALEVFECQPKSITKKYAALIKDGFQAIYSILNTSNWCTGCLHQEEDIEMDDLDSVLDIVEKITSTTCFRCLFLMDSCNYRKELFNIVQALFNIIDSPDPKLKYEERDRYERIGRLEASLLMDFVSCQTIHSVFNFSELEQKFLNLFINPDLEKVVFIEILLNPLFDPDHSVAVEELETRLKLFHSLTTYGKESQIKIEFLFGMVEEKISKKTIFIESSRVNLEKLIQTFFDALSKTQHHIIRDAIEDLKQRLFWSVVKTLATMEKEEISPIQTVGHPKKKKKQANTPTTSLKMSSQVQASKSLVSAIIKTIGKASVLNNLLNDSKYLPFCGLTTK